MKQHYDITLGLTVREYETSGDPHQLPFLKFQIGEVRNVLRTAAPHPGVLPNGYNLTVPIFFLRSHGRTFNEAKARLKQRDAAPNN